MKKIQRIPFYLLNSFKYYIQNNEKMTDSEMMELLEYYPGSFKSKVQGYRIISVDSDLIPIITSTDKAWSKNKNYPFQKYLQASEYYHQFEGLVSGFDLTKILNDCQYHNDVEIQDLSRFAAEQEIIAFSIINLKYLGAIPDLQLESIINNKLNVDFSKITKTSCGIKI